MLACASSAGRSAHTTGSLPPPAPRFVLQFTKGGHQLAPRRQNSTITFNCRTLRNALEWLFVAPNNKRSISPSLCSAGEGAQAGPPPALPVRVDGNFSTSGLAALACVLRPSPPPLACCLVVAAALALHAPPGERPRDPRPAAAFRRTRPHQPAPPRVAL